MIYALVFIWFATTPQTVVTVDIYATKAECHVAAKGAAIDPQMGKVVCIKKKLR